MGTVGGLSADYRSVFVKKPLQALHFQRFLETRIWSLPPPTNLLGLILSSLSFPTCTKGLNSWNHLRIKCSFS